MIKKSTYIRSFTDSQQKQLEKIGKEENFKTTPEILFFALDKYFEQRKEIEKLNGIISVKKEEIYQLNLKIDFFKSASKRIHELSDFLKKEKK
ncbi:hypothetical protein KHA90_11830 [Flavobacterium psychroterrae]|uniref:CopG family transcriptional regulator n=1 Tax=Flavobacterium psychroterrae TaxID=2133767 RepID=A0ABS5PBQ6_9FLAO|nr:hypothetical protein [Flavobacterium psychroterrae]MBS7231716.1 hypothetical protein [Flavobacterium psychroterrae]